MPENRCQQRASRASVTQECRRLSPDGPAPQDGQQRPGAAHVASQPPADFCEIEYRLMQLEDTVEAPSDATDAEVGAYVVDFFRDCSEFEYLLQYRCVGDSGCSHPRDWTWPHGRS